MILAFIFIRDKPRNPQQPEESYKEMWKAIFSELYVHYDWFGAFFSFAMVACFLLALTSSAIPTIPQAAWIALFPVSVVFIALFVLNEKYLVTLWEEPKAPLLHLSLFHDRIFTFANFGSLVANMSRSIVLLISILFLQGPYRQDPYWAGIMTMPLGIGILLSGSAAGHLSDKFGRKLLQVSGPFLAAIGTLGLACVKFGVNYWLFAFALFVTGTGHALYNSPNMASVMLKVPPASRGVASGVRVWVMMLGSCIGMIVAFAIVIKQLPIEDLLILFLYGEGDASKLPPGLDLNLLNTTIVRSLSYAYWVAFACIVLAGFCSLLIPGKFIVKNSYNTADVGTAKSTAPPGTPPVKT